MVCYWTKNIFLQILKIKIKIKTHTFTKTKPKTPTSPTHPSNTPQKNFKKTELPQKSHKKLHTQQQTKNLFKKLIWHSNLRQILIVENELFLK